MKFNKKIIIIFTMLLSFCLVMSFKTTTNAVSFSVEETNYRGAVIKVSNSKKMTGIKIYQQDNNGNWVKFFEDNNVDDTEKSYFISKYRLSTTDASKLKIIVTSEDGLEETTEKDVQKLPDAPDPIPVPTTTSSPSSKPSSSSSPKPSTSVSPTISPTATNSPKPSQSNEPSTDKNVTKVTLPKTLTLYVEQSKKLKLEIQPKDATTTLTWSTSNANVAKISKDGTVTGVKSGEATITVKTANGKTAKCKVTVKKKKVTLNGHKVSLQDGNDRVYFLDVSDMHTFEDGSRVQGSDAIIIESNGKYAMIDVGVGYQGNRVAQYLRDIGVDELEWILITHAHSDHYGGLKKVLNTVKVKKIYIKDITSGKSGQIEKYKKNVTNAISGTTNKANKNITKICDVKNKNNRNLTVGEVKISLFNAAKDRLEKKSSGENVNSVTALAKINGKKLYFAADIVNDTSIKVNAENIAAKAVGKVDFYKVAHHSYSPNNAVTALSYLQPKECVVTNTTPGKKPSTKPAHDRIAKYAKTFKYTASGTVILTIAEDGKLLYNKLDEDK